ncbi:TetR/AcrR family transcriptional regulator [Sulfurospirillum diekertiae]|nr:TetR/AcrR family transcriptional regulator [Sulfurospirillum diekertiae]
MKRNADVLSVLSLIDSVVKLNHVARKLLMWRIDFFLDNGYENVSMNDIVKHAGGSLATLYKHFGNKEQLFIYILEQKSEEVFGEWGRKSVCYEGRIEEFLTETGRMFLDLVTTPDAILFHRLLISIGYINDSRLNKTQIQNLMSVPVIIIANYLENEKVNGHIEVEDTYLVAEQFLNAVKGPFLFQTILGIQIDISEETRLKALKQVVTIFCRGLHVIQ